MNKNVEPRVRTGQGSKSTRPAGSAHGNLLTTGFPQRRSSPIIGPHPDGVI